MKRYFYAGVATIALMSYTLPATAQNIFEALGETYNTNPTLQAERAYLRSVDENVSLAKSGYRPNIALTGNYRNSDNSSDNSGDTEVTTKSMAAKLSQPLFNGFSTVNSVKSADQVVRAEQNNLYNVEQNVFLEASTAYLDVVRDTAIVELQKNNEKLLKKRLEETLQRFKVGEVTRTDVSQAEARYSQAKSDRIASEGNLEAAKAVYVRIIGSEPKELEEPVAIKDFLPENYDVAINIALKNNYSIRQAKHLFNAKGYEVYANTGALFPQLSFDATAAKIKTDYNNLIGDDDTDSVEWGLNLSLPLYNSGESRAKIRQSKHQKWQAQELVLETERLVKATVSSAWEYMKTNESKIEAIKDQVKANKIALDGVQKEEALGNRTILDVLDAYQELLNSNVNEVTARRDYYVSAMQLLLSMGKLTAKDLKLGVDLYDAKKFYKETKDKWIALE